jgi:hypothetical protein
VPTRHGDPDVLLERLLDRVQNWREISPTYSGGARLPINLIAAMYAGGDRSAVLTWLRAGLPYAVEGDWETGDGFVLVSHWVMDWGLWAAVRADQSGDNVSARALRLDCFGESGRWTPEMAAQLEAATRPRAGHLPPRNDDL